ncbi:hypothetical protein [Streptomyces sp. bgisy032]|uniref:hypothetical protein n=1 Tax=Streptomyces sp. bgisy032 TaxID=3413773 RepID=UPI003D730C39
MRDALPGPLGPDRPAGSAAVTRAAATARDGAPALTVGLAADRSFETGRPVRTGTLFTDLATA